MAEPVARTASAVIAFTVPAVPTGMKAGVSTAPCAVCITPARAAPSMATMRWENIGNARPRGVGGRSVITFQQTRIAIGIEAISRFDRVRIGPMHSLNAGKSAHQHEQRRARQMEIGQQQIDGAQSVAWQNEQTCIARERLNAAVLGYS